MASAARGLVIPEIMMAIIRGPCPWIPDIFPEIQGKFRDDVTVVIARVAWLLKIDCHLPVTSDGYIIWQWCLVYWFVH